MTPEEHAARCKQTKVAKSWSSTGRLMGRPPNQFRVKLHTVILVCGHRVVTSERVTVP
ncbi:MAG: hypothetical protein JRN62_10140 [Nitrososphaerota archaeon]|nr:hypothetical protein [Nitrososphaerota archaeon]MDG6949824.1 hypothetical protein [Nitrososphaerota archaeon]